MLSAAKYVTELASRGRYHFTTREARAALGGSLPAIRAALRRLKAKHEIAAPYRGFHVIVPPEYRRLGCLPAEQFVPQLMDHLGEDRYYTALLSAAEIHGAAHHRPQTYQVMLPRNRRPVVCGAVYVQFIARGDLKSTPVVERNTPRGRLLVSSPEATAFELVGYAGRCGGLDNVASVLFELVDAINPEKLVEAAKLCPIAWVQRLGFLLELIEQGDVANVLLEQVGSRAVVIAPLVRAKPGTHAQRVDKWKLAVNASVEPDL